MSQPSVPRRRSRFFRYLGISCLTIAIATGSWALWQYHGPVPAQQIFRGVYYGCERVPETDESGGLFHWIRADLSVPGVSLFVTPKDPEAEAQGFEYRLHYTSTAVQEYGLAAAVNGTRFVTGNHYPLPGALATSFETVVSGHVPNHIHWDSYVMWWDDNAVGHLEATKPPRREAIAHAKWAISGQQNILITPVVADHGQADWRTIIAANPAKHLVWIACFDKASFHFAAQTMQAMGATLATAVDGGTSMSMVIGSGAQHVRSGTVTGNWRPVCNQFGIRALPLP